MKHTFFPFLVLTLFAFKSNAQTVIDYDGNLYDTVLIGTQVWLKENLKVTHYRNGDVIPNIIDSIQWAGLTTGAYCDYDNNPSWSQTYGRLYNWYAVNDNRNLCPTNWHVPTETEWETLINYLGDSSIAGGKMKEVGTIHWQSPNTGATNISGFTCLPASGRIGYLGSFNGLGKYAYFWGSTENDDSYAYYRYLTYNNSWAYENYSNKSLGISVRCLKDSTTTQIQKLNNHQNIQIYPNPTIDIIYINYTDTENAKVQVYDIMGKCVLKIQLNRGTNDIDVSKLLRGIYVIKLIGENWTLQRKLIKE